jgi:hypothetical protein
MSGDHQRSLMVRADDGARIGAARKRDVKASRGRYSSLRR